MMYVCECNKEIRLSPEEVRLFKMKKPPMRRLKQKTEATCSKCGNKMKGRLNPKQNSTCFTCKKLYVRNYYRQNYGKGKPSQGERPFFI